MGVVRVNEVSVTRGSVAFGLQGTWCARLWLQGTNPDDVAGDVELAIGEETFSGTSTAATDAGNEVSVEIVGGAGGLLKECEPQHYVAPATVRSVVTDALEVGGEQLSPTADSAVLDSVLPMWTRVRESVADVLKGLLEPLGASWRVLADGSVWIGKETWPEAAEVLVESETPTLSSFRVAIETAAVLPGVTLQGKQISSVAYEITPKSIRADAIYGAGRGGIQDDLAKLIRKDTARFDFFASYQMELAGQNNDGTLELKSTDKRVPKMSKIPQLGIPGMTEAKLLPKASVMIAFRNGDRSKPFAYSADLGRALSLTLSATTTLKLEGTAVEAGGNQELVKHIPMLAWVAQLTSACAVAGISVPPLVNVQTTITKGA